MINVFKTIKGWGLLAGLGLLFGLLPFHALFTTWAGELFGYRSLWQSWKEVLVLILVGVALRQLVNNKGLGEKIWSWWVNRLILIYTALHLLMVGLVFQDLEAALLGLRNNLIFLAVFVVAQIAATKLTPARQHAITKVLLIGAGLVAGFGILQAYLLPRDWLVILGYGPLTVVPYLLLQDSDIVRIISTLDSPNTLGSFLILPWSLTLVGLIKKSINRMWILLLPAVGLTLYHSHSRSAWIGVILATGVIAWGALPKAWLRKALWAGVGTAAAAALLLIYLVPKVPTLQSVVLHAPLDKAPDESSNADHLEAVLKGTAEVVRDPLGDGPGTAGPASFSSPNPLIPENYYLQVGLEVGLLGLLLFIAINILVAKELVSLNKRNQWGMALLASFVGLTFMNLLLHTWANGPTAIIWWGMAGLAIGQRRLKQVSA